MERTARLGVAAVAVCALVVGVQAPGPSASVAERWWVLVGAGLVAATFAWWSLRTGRHEPWDIAVAALARGQAVVLWKPGCPYCERLLRTLAGDERVVWVNVWKDPDANRVVREHNSGDEFVPTVLLGGEVLRNPTIAELRTALDVAAS